MTHPQTPEPSRTLVARPPDRTPAVAVRPLTSEFGLGAPAAPGEVGVLGPYRIVKELGKGGMGAVYLAVDTRLDRELALKVMLQSFAADPAAKERFLREAKAVAKVSHDHVVTIFEADERDGVPYIAMQFLQGAPLDEYLKKKGSPGVAQCVRIVREAALGLAAAHARGLVHRDIKPANLWLEAPHGRVKVLDFGLAKPIGSDSELTKSGAVVGTPAYMSPEQARGQKVDARTDIFSLGAVLYRLLTGRNPFLGEHIMAVLTALAVEEPTPVCELNPDVPEPLARVVHRMLAKNPDARPQTAHEVAELLRSATERPAAAGPTPLPVVVHTLSVSVAPESAFADLFPSADPTEAEPARPAEPAREPQPRGNRALPLAGAAVLAVVLGAAALAVRYSTPDRPADDVAKSDTPKPPAPTKPPAPSTKKPAPPADPDRRAADYTLSVGGSVRADDRDIRAVADLPKSPFRLTVANFEFNSPVTDAGLSAFKDCKHLVSLNLSFTQVTDAGVAHFKDCKGLTFLNLNSTKVSNTGVLQFKDCSSLKALYLNGTGVTDAGLLAFKDLSGVTRFAASNTALTDAALAAFKDCKAMEHFSADGTRVTDAGLAVFDGSKTFGILNLSGTPVTAAGLAHFKQCDALEELVLSNCPNLTDAALAQFRNCKRFVTLNLAGTQVTDATLEALVQHTGMRELNLSGTQVSAAGVEKLRKALPGCRVEWSAPK